ncbi:MAG: hypothetical protein OXI24_12300 [Candidatus Poribacteria bacterium]|nr:hypothetical protein [Candidatus Poribacteria bacterium]
MRNKVYWGLGVLIVLFIGVFVLVMVNEYAENDQLEADAKKAQQQADQNKQQKNVKDNPPTDDLVPISDPTEPIDPPPVEEKPQVTEVSNGTEKPIDMMTDEEFREWHRGGRSLEEYEAKKEVELIFFPGQIEQLEELVASGEASIKRWEEHFQRNPNSIDGRKMYEQRKRSLSKRSRQLVNLKRTMEVIYNVK